MSKGSTPQTQTQQVQIPDEFKAWIFGPGFYGGTPGGGSNKMSGALSGATAGAQLGTMVAPGLGTAIGAGAGGLLGLFGSKSSKGTKPTYLNAGFSGILPSALDLMKSGKLDPGLVQSEGSKLAEESTMSLVDMLNNDFLPSTRDLYDRVGNRDLVNAQETQDVIAASTRPIQEQLMRYAVPATQDAAIAAGQLGSSRQGIAEGLARSDANAQMGDIASRISFGALQEQLAGERMALQLSPQIMQLLGMPTALLEQVGKNQERYDLESRSAEGNNLRALANLLQGFIPGANSTQTQQDATTGKEGIGELMSLVGAIKGGFSEGDK